MYRFETEDEHNNELVILSDILLQENCILLMNIYVSQLSQN